MADVPEGSFTHTLEDIDAATSQVENAIGSAASLAAAIAAAATAAATAAEEAAIADYYKTGTLIPDNSDLDDYTYTQLGHYYVASNASAGTIDNMPGPYGGRLEVIATIDNDTYCKHIYYANTDAGQIYTRRKLSSGWSAWEELITRRTLINAAFGIGTAITATTDARFDLDDLTAPRRYYIGASASKYVDHLPYSAGTSGIGCEVIVDQIQTENRVRQTVVQNNGASNVGKYWVRMATSGTIANNNLVWSNWFLFQGTEQT